MNKRIFPLMALFLLIGFIVFNKNSYYNFVMHTHAQLPVLFSIIYLITPKNNIALKCLSLFMLLSYSLLLLKALLQYYFNMPALPVKAAYFIEVFIFIPFSIYQCTRKQIKSDPFTEENYMYVIKRPDKITGFLVTLLSIPMQSLSVYSNGRHYRMKKVKVNDPKSTYFVRLFSKYTSGMAGVEDICKNKLDNYILIDTGVKINDQITQELDNTQGMIWTLRNNCFTVYQKNLGSIIKILWNRVWQRKNLATTKEKR